MTEKMERMEVEVDLDLAEEIHDLFAEQNLSKAEGLLTLCMVLGMQLAPGSHEFVHKLAQTVMTFTEEWRRNNPQETIE